MKKIFLPPIFTFILWHAFISPVKPVSTSEVPYPEGFKTWRHIKTGLTGFYNNPQLRTDGFHYIYANNLALQGYKNNNFPNGSMLVFEKYTVDTTHQMIEPGERKFIDVMYKDSAAFATTGGWGFQEFPANSKTERLLSPATQQKWCYNCHAGKKEKDYVFTFYKE